VRVGAGVAARAAGFGAVGSAIRRRRVLYGGGDRRRPPADAVADPGDQARHRRGEAALRAPGRVRLRHRRGRLPCRDLGWRCDQRATLPVAEGDHGSQEEAARHADRGRSGYRGLACRGRGLGGALDRCQGATEEAPWPDHRLARRTEADLMADILVYALHYEGAFNKNSLGAVSEGAKLASALGGEVHAVVVGDGATDELCAQLGHYGARTVYRVPGPEGLAQPVVDAMAQLVAAHGFSYALFGGGLLGFEIGAGLAARLGAGVAMEVTAVRAP